MHLATEAEPCFQKAIEITRQQAAKSLELCAATSFARAWQTQGKPKQAQQLLGEIYAWFTEGFDTADFPGSRIPARRAIKDFPTPNPNSANIATGAFTLLLTKQARIFRGQTLHRHEKFSLVPHAIEAVLEKAA